MYWIVAGLLFSVFSALTMLINQKYKLDGHLISGLRGIFVGLLFCAALPFVDFPKGEIFWALIAVQVALSTFYNARFYESAARYGAGSTARISVLAIAFGVIFWWGIDYGRFLLLLKDPPMLSGIVLSLFVICAGFYFMALKGSRTRPGEVAYLMPAVVISAVMLINRKELMEHAEFFSAAVYYCSVSIFLSGVLNISIYAIKVGFKDFKKQLQTPGVLKAGVIMALASSITILCGNTATFYVPNPAFINALTLTIPLWVFGFDKLLGRNPKINWAGCIIMLLGLVCLIYFANSPLHTAHW